MGNCLVTKLKEVVNNDNLDYLGYFKVHYDVSEAGYNPSDRGFVVGCSSAGTIKIIGGRFLDYNTQQDLGTEFNLAANEYRTFLVSNDACTVFLPKYTTTFLQVGIGGGYTFGKGSVESFDFVKYSDFITFWGAIDGRYISELDFSMFADKANLTNLVVRRTQGDGTGINCTLSYLAHKPELKYIRLMGPIGITGTLNDLADDISLVQVVVDSGGTLTGTVEGFAAAQVAAGRTTGKCSLNINSSIITYNGNRVNNVEITYDSSVSGGYSVEVL